MRGERWILIGGLLGGLGVILGAFGAHWLPSWLAGQDLDAATTQRRIEVLEIGVRYQMYHALAILVVGLLELHRGGPTQRAAAWCWLLGIAIFSGLLYLLAFTGWGILGAIVPLGGLLMIVGWILLAVGAGRVRS